MTQALVLAQNGNSQTEFQCPLLTQSGHQEATSWPPLFSETNRYLS
jgi:hypothetical protein